jgi:hypothetical protein
MDKKNKATKVFNAGFRLTFAEWEFLRQKAKRMHIPLSALYRLRLLYDMERKIKIYDMEKDE